MPIPHPKLALSLTHDLLRVLSMDTWWKFGHELEKKALLAYVSRASKQASKGWSKHGVGVEPLFCLGFWDRGRACTRRGGGSTCLPAPAHLLALPAPRHPPSPAQTPLRSPLPLPAVPQPLQTLGLYPNCPWPPFARRRAPFDPHSTLVTCNGAASVCPLHCHVRSAPQQM